MLDCRKFRSVTLVIQCCTTLEAWCSIWTDLAGPSGSVGCCGTSLEVIACNAPLTFSVITFDKVAGLSVSLPARMPCNAARPRAVLAEIAAGPFPYGHWTRLPTKRSPNNQSFSSTGLVPRIAITYLFWRLLWRTMYMEFQSNKLTARSLIGTRRIVTGPQT